MKKETIRRFTRPDVWLHWSQAVLYLLLFGSGTLLLLGRVFNHPLASQKSLGTLHRVAGVVLVALLGQTLLLSVVADNFRSFWHTLRECLRWRWSDIVWLLKVPFNAITPRVKLPPADRFNAGQKLHLLVIVCVLVGFSVSGLLMMLIPGALAPWIVHLICFIPAAIFLVLHLFLSLLNPETRKALPSIFSGHMPLELARQHHGLWAGQSDSGGHPSYVSLRMVLIMIALAMAVVGTFVIWYGPARVSNVVTATIAHHGTNAITPAPLSEVHGGGNADTDNCAVCHLMMASPPSEKCLACHTEIHERMVTGSGFHGKIVGSCRQCHAEHEGVEATLISLDRQAFNHARTNFPLDGKHQAVPCEKCHEKADPDAGGRMQYTGLDYNSCMNCHLNPHSDPRAGHCLECHTMQGWGRNKLTFDHDRDSQFPLLGAHAKLDCEKCHPRSAANDRVQVRLFDVGKACRDCHADPHRGQFKETCDQCHTEQGWTGRWLVSFHGPDSSFPLRGKHANVRCDQCHRIPEKNGRLANAQFAGLSHDCQSCHADPHAGQMSSACNACHTETGWAGPNLIFSHDKHSLFHLDTLHSSVSCDRCHSGPVKRYRPLPHECGACHTTEQAAMQGTARTLSGPPDPHNGRLSCTDCHDVNEPRQHPGEFAARCATCHSVRYSTLFYSWADALEGNLASIRQELKHIDDPNDARRLQLERILEDAAAAGFHNLNLTQEIFRAGIPTQPENVK